MFTITRALPIRSPSPVPELLAIADYYSALVLFLNIIGTEESSLLT